MKVNHSEWIWLDDQGVCSAQHLTEVSGLSNEELDDLIENDVIVPINDTTQPRTFPLRYIVVANRARRLRDDFELDRHGVMLTLTLMQRIDELQQELLSVRARPGGKIVSAD
ncbi:MAG: chaperone modulator CbpM [Burkholderiaceae bacterium]